jgi:hypothetical protein
VQCANIKVTIADPNCVVTYDITWAAYSGWVWTTLEAQLAVICASAPALKVFFNQYFSSYITRAGYTETFKTIPHSYGRNTKMSQLSIQCTAGGKLDGDVPLTGITVSQGLDVRIEERDHVSQKSFASTRGLTAVPLPLPTAHAWRGRSDLVDGCRTVCAAFRPGRRGRSSSRSRSRAPNDVEAGRAF